MTNRSANLTEKMPVFHESESTWMRHGPFGMWLVRALKPRSIVELGTQDGFSYFCFCQALAEAGISSECCAVGAWWGNADEKANRDKIFRSVQAKNVQYEKFSKLLRKTFAEALQDFDDGSIDLLHIAGGQFDEKVKAIFESWRCKLSDRAVVLFHNTKVPDRLGGVSRYWSEISATRPSINFEYQNGLGVLFWGTNCVDVTAKFVDLIAQANAQRIICDHFERKGDAFVLSDSERDVADPVHSTALSEVETPVGDLDWVGMEADRTFEAYMQIRPDLDRYALELERMRAERDKAHADSQELRRVVTRLLQSPLVSLGENLHHKTARKLSRIFALISPRIAKRLTHSASKVAPKRFMASPEAGNLISDFDINRPSADSGAKTGDPVIVLPFKKRLFAKRPRQKTAVFLHAFHVDQANFFRECLRNIPNEFDLFVSTNTEEKAEDLRKTFADGPAQRTEVRAMPNRGRDVAAKLVGFGEVHAKYELVLHIHTKKSSHHDILKGWRTYILDALIGSRETVDSILDAFSSAPQLGMVAPPNFPAIRPHMHWGPNFGLARDLAERMGIALTSQAPLDFPSGSMFWARSDALSPLLNIGLTADDFPDELGQLDGTIAHAIERLFFHSCESAGLRWIHAGPLRNVPPLDNPIRIVSPSELDCVLTDEMHSLLSPGIHPKSEPTAAALIEELE